MRINRKLGWFGILTILVILAAGIFSGGALAQAGTSLSVNPTPAEARTCSTSSVAVRVADVTDLTAFHLELSFDPSKIEVTAVAPGSFLIGAGETYLPEPTNAVNNTTGTVVWGLAKQGSGGNPNPVSGNGDILVLTIKAKLPNETSALTIDGAKSMLVDWPEAQSIPFTDTDGVINTRSCAPTDIALSNATIAENQPGNTVIGTLSATDPDTGDTSFTYTFADLVGHPDAQYFNISGSSLRANIPFDYETKSSYSIRIKVTDPWGESYEENFIISVTDINDAPVLAYVGNRTVDELTTLSFTAAATDEDLPAQTLTYSLADGASGAVPTGASINPATGAFTWTPTEAQGPGEYTFTVKVCDNGTPALCDEEEIKVTVNEVNVAPVLGAIGDKTVDELTLLSFTAAATDADIPTNTLTFSLVGAPAGAAIDPATGVFTWTPTEAQGPGEYTFTVKVCDNGTPVLCDEEEIKVTVFEVNTAPTARDQSVTTPEDTPIDILLDVSDPENDPFTTTIITVPSHGQVSVNGIVVTYTPDLNYYGADSFTYKVNDGLEDSNIATVSITVTPVNDPPVAYGMTVDTLENFPVDFELLATDPEGDIGTFIIVTTPAHGTLDCDGRYCTYTPDPNWNGEDGFYFKVNDGELDSNEAFVKIVVHQGPRIYIPILFK